MSRRSYLTVNLPSDLVEWVDRQVENAPLGIGSRDEFVRVAVGLLGAALNTSEGVPMRRIQDILMALNRQQEVPRWQHDDATSAEEGPVHGGST